MLEVGNKLSIAIHFSSLGPYHFARIDSAFSTLSAKGWDVVAIETAGSDSTYAWHGERRSHKWLRQTTFPHLELNSIPPSEIKIGIYRALDAIKPHVVAIAGWGSPDARACLSWCRRNGAASIVMSETREVDGRRRFWKEAVKKQIVKRFDAALVGAHSHHEYLVKLGMKSQQIEFGYNVIDNQYFRNESEKLRSAEANSERKPYFLASNRFVERKNLIRLVEAFSEAQKRHSNQSRIWDLCLLGDGVLMPDLKRRCEELGLAWETSSPWGANREHLQSPVVFLPGFRQIEELPKFYSLAACFVHPALEEPWGLVINEAMACGLPILSSSNVGAAEELVEGGQNGGLFDPVSVSDISFKLREMMDRSDVDLAHMGMESVRILDERCPTSAFGAGLVNLIEGPLARC